jgi:SAM-dependent methyltransferase
VESVPNKFIQIDEEGYVLFGEIRVTDAEVGHELLESITLTENMIVHSELRGEKVIVEAFDQPYVALQVDYDGKWWIQCPYQSRFSFSLETLTLDEWDRFHGTTEKGIPFVFSRAAQAEFFNLLEDYDDETITHHGKTYQTQAYLQDLPDANKGEWWTEVYFSEGKPRWDLGEAAPALKSMLPRLKLPKSRILVLGCGEGHDAAFFAKDGHNVTAVDISPEAIRRAKEKYGHLSTINFVEADIFKLGREFESSYDIVFEHTCFCAINPSKRNELIKVWNRCLIEKGFLMGLFFVTEKRQGPPFGASEWELRERLKKGYQFLFWGRWRESIPRRLGKELFVYAQKRS